MSGLWFESFRRSPERAIADLFSGRAGAGSDLRLDVPELLYQQFPPRLADERAQLDDALGSWLSDMREGYVSQVKLLGFSVYGKRIGDALIALQLLDLPQTRGRIRADTGAWLRWLSPLRLAPERDPGLECFRLLTRGQPDARHTALWLRLATDPRPEYLSVALAGLRLLPNQDDARKNQALMLQALLRHAVKLHHEAGGACTFFDGHFAALRGFFPRGPQHWNRVLDEALDGFLEHTGEPIAKELADGLRADLQTNLRGRRRRPSSGRARMPMPATQVEWDNLEKDILGSDQPPETLARRLFEILERNHDYAKATGVSHYFVRTLHDLGTALLLKRHALGSADMTRFGVMIQRALVWEPANLYCWMLWAEWFQAQRRIDAHEATLREMLRLFPSDLHARTELACLLIDRGGACWDEARRHLQSAMDRDPGDGHSAEWFQAQGRIDAHEAKLREMLGLFPSDLHARVELARLLISRGDTCWDEAERHLRSAMDRDPDDGGSHVVMAQLRVLRHRAAEAGVMLAEFPGLYPDTATVRESLDRLRAGIYLDTTARYAAWYAARYIEIQEGVDRDDPPMSPPDALQELLRRGSLAGEFSRAQIAMDDGLAAPPTDLIRQESLKGDPLAGFYSQWLMPEETPKCPPHAWAWQACRYWQESTRTEHWQRLATQFPEAASETEFLRVLATSDDGDQSGAIEWRERHCFGSNGASRPVDAFMRESQDRLVGTDPRERDELAGMVMACAATDALDVVWGSAA